MKTSGYFFSVLLCCFFSLLAFAQQEKHYPDWHDLSVEDRLEYNSNPQRMLPDARTAFQNGEYGKALMICSMHFVVYGDETGEKEEKNTLESKAKKCYDLSREMTALQSSGKVAEAKKKALEIIGMNTQDKAAQQVLLLSEPVVAPRDTTPAPIPAPVPEPAHVTGLSLSQEHLSMIAGETAELTVKITPSDAVDKTVAWSSDNISVATIDPNGMVRALAAGSAVVTVIARDGSFTARCQVTVQPEEQPVQIRVTDTIPEKPAVEVATPPVRPSSGIARHTRFVAKAGMVYFIDLSPHLSPAAALGVYDLGGSRVGLEIGGCFLGLRGLNASLAFNLSNTVYLRAGAGYFSCSSTKGLNAVAGVNFILGQHFCLDLEAAYYPAILSMGSETIQTSGVSYQMPVVVTLMRSGIATSIKIGWAF